MHRRRDQSRDIDAPDLGRGALAVARRRRGHRTRHVGADDHLARHLRDAPERQLQRVLQRRLDLERHIGIDLAQRHHQLVGQGADGTQSIAVGQPGRDALGHPLHTERAVARQGVEVHPQGLPPHARRQLAPLLRGQRKGGEPCERHRRQRKRRIPLPRLERGDLGGQRGDVIGAPDQPAVESLARGVRRLGVNHLDDVGQRRIIARRRRHQIAHRRLLQPALDQPLRTRAERRAPDLARTQDLHIGAQHPPAVDHMPEHRHRKIGIGDRQISGEQRRHILHRAGPARIDGGLGHEHRIDRTGRVQHVGELRFGRAVEIRGQRAGRRELRKLGLGAISISRGACMVARIRRRQKLRDRRSEKSLIGHLPTSTNWSGWLDSNQRLPASKTGTLTHLSYTLSRPFRGGRLIPAAASCRAGW